MKPTKAPLPEACPDCGGPINETGVEPQYQTEIPRQPIHRQINVHCGDCEQCGKHVRGRHSLQTSDAAGAAASQLGPDAQAAIVVLNKDMGLSHGKISRTMKSMFGIKITPGACAQIVLRAGRKLQPAYQEILDKIKHSKKITPDETGWRLGGKLVWLHDWAGDDGAIAYVIDPHRGAGALEKVIGIDYSGTLIHDGFSSYDRFKEAEHQQCVAHVLRRTHKMTETAKGRAGVFPQQVIGLFQEALAVRDQVKAGDQPESILEGAYENFSDRLIEMTWKPRQNETNETLAKHLYKYGPQWFTFVIDPTIPATNHEAEQGLRGPIVNRKVWGGNRDDSGTRPRSEPRR